MKYIDWVLRASEKIWNVFGRKLTGIFIILIIVKLLDGFCPIPYHVLLSPIYYRIIQFTFFYIRVGYIIKKKYPDLHRYKRNVISVIVEHEIKKYMKEKVELEDIK